MTERALQYPPDLYAALHRGTPGDIEFYAAFCRGQPSVLELGCGYGRILNALDPPVRVGVDLHPGLLQLAEQTSTGPKYILDDMCTIDLGRRFSRVVLPHSTLFCLPDEAGVRRCLQNAARHLEADGQLALDTYCADQFHNEQRPEDTPEGHLDFVADISVEDRTYEVLERSEWTRDQQRIDVTYLHLWGEQRIEATIEHRYLLLAQMQALLEEEGFSIRTLEGDFGGSPAHEEADSVVITAELR